MPQYMLPIKVSNGRCSNDCGTCPLGKMGSQTRCTMAELMSAGIPMVVVDIQGKPAPIQLSGHACHSCIGTGRRYDAEGRYKPCVTCKGMGFISPDGLGITYQSNGGEGHEDCHHHCPNGHICALRNGHAGDCIPEPIGKPFTWEPWVALASVAALLFLSGTLLGYMLK